MQKVLVIHPDDRSTDFLKDIYKNIPNCTVVSSPTHRDLLETLIKQHDRVIMLGHGTPLGLLGSFLGEKFAGYVVDKSMVKLLKEKKNNVYIWCNADQFVNFHGLQGFYSGMFISEVIEARMFNIFVTQKDIDYSNELFAKKLGKIINKHSPTKIAKLLKEEYNPERIEADTILKGMQWECPVIRFNNDRLYSSETNTKPSVLTKFLNFFN